MVDRNENNRYISRACDFVTECDKQKKKEKNETKSFKYVRITK